MQNRRKRSLLSLYHAIVFGYGVEMKKLKNYILNSRHIKALNGLRSRATNLSPTRISDSLIVRALINYGSKLPNSDLSKIIETELRQGLKDE